MKTLDIVIKRENNNFDLIRVCAAVGVLLGHSFYLNSANGYIDPVKYIISFEYTGSIAVYLFFFLSGLFITASFVNSNSRSRFLIMRFFRIWPGLIFCLILTVFIIGTIVTDLKANQYFSSVLTWRYLFFNATLYKDIIKYLPGVFEKNHSKGVVNGTLWTLHTEIECYLIIFALGITGLLKKPYFIGFTFLVALFLYLTDNIYFIHFFMFPLAAKNALFFLFGATCFTVKRYVVINYKISLMLVVICLLLYNSSNFTAVFYLAICYNVLTIATSVAVRYIRLPGDYSYGIYIYGFVVQQLTNNFFPEISSLLSLCFVIPITLLLAVASWHCLERPSLIFAKNLTALINHKKLQTEPIEKIV